MSLIPGIVVIRSSNELSYCSVCRIVGPAHGEKWHKTYFENRKREKDKQDSKHNNMISYFKKLQDKIIRNDFEEKILERASRIPWNCNYMSSLNKLKNKLEAYKNDRIKTLMYMREKMYHTKNDTMVANLILEYL